MIREPIDPKLSRIIAVCRAYIKTVYELAYGTWNLSLFLRQNWTC